ncbi:MAG TPA: carboxypeptidase regulatory-like domain-containing protein, partial [Planctomycetota bacterium]|nr:carboxypeptidase regulatory-like domain-containing protein [Planctomycetota bacterium]
MRRIQLVLIAGGVLAVLATVLWMLRAPPDGEQRAASVLAGARVVPGDGPDAAANAARDARDAAPERLPSVAATGSSETPAPVAPAGPVAPAPEADDDSVPALFRGRVVDDARVPIAGATVVYWPSQATLALYGLGTDSAGAALDVLPRAVTDGGGRFELQVRHRNGTTLTELGSDPMLVAIAGEFATRTTTCRAFRGGERDVGDLALELGARVIGRIVDSQSRPVAGAIVRPWPRDARSLRGIADRKQDWAFDELAGAFGTVVSGSDGSFRTGPLWDGSVQLMVGADGFLEQERGRVVVTVGAPTDLGDIVLQRGATLAGRVHDGQGAAVAGARIVAWEPQGVRIPRPAGSAPEDDILQELDRHSDDKDVRTDSDGSFLLPGRGAANHSLIVDAAGFEPLLVQDLAAGGPALDLTVVRAASLRLTVLDAESRAPLDSAEVSAQRMVSGAETAGAETGSALPVRAEGAGLFVVERLGRLRTQLVVQAPGHALAALALPGAEPATAREQSVELRREARLQGLVTAADGTPIAKASLVAAFQLTEPFRLDDRKTATDAHGRYLVAGLPPGEWALTADALDFAPVERRVTLVQGQPQPDLDFVLPAAASVFGACFTGEG